MITRISHIIQLIEELAAKTGYPLNYYGFGQMCVLIPEDGISQRYLDDLYRNMKKRMDEGKATAKPNRKYLDAIAVFLGYDSFQDFSDTSDRQYPGSLSTCAGNWWNITVSGESLLHAPVNIMQDDQKKQTLLVMKTDKAEFSGVLEEGQGYVFTTLRSSAGNHMSMVLKLENSPGISMLQGVFCTASSTGEPVAGRTLLLREKDLTYSKMRWNNQEIQASRPDERIKRYFSL